MATNPYGYTHQQERAHHQAEIERTGGIRCHCRGSCLHHAGRCPTIIRPGTRWHLGHSIAVALGGADGPKAPWCEACNTRDGQRIGQMLQAAPRSSRDWDTQGEGGSEVHQAQPPRPRSLQS